MLRTTLSLILLFLVGTPTYADYWRITSITGQVTLVEINTFNFESDNAWSHRTNNRYWDPRAKEEQLTDNTLANWKYQFTVGSGFFTNPIPFESVKNFRYEKCKGGTTSRERCNTVVTLRNGERVEREAEGPWFLGRPASLNELSQWELSLRTLSGTGIDSVGNVFPWKLTLGWSDVYGNYASPRLIDGIDFLDDSEAKAALAMAAEKMTQNGFKNNAIEPIEFFKKIASEDQLKQAKKLAGEYWLSIYRTEANGIFNSSNPSLSALAEFARKVPEDKATLWSEVDFDSLAEKAMAKYKIAKEKEDREAAERKRAQEAVTAKLRAEAEAQAQVEETRIKAWRRTLKIGDDTFCGPIIEVRFPMIKLALNAQIQGFTSEPWLKVNDTFPPEYGCLNRNGKLSTNR